MPSIASRLVDHPSEIVNQSAAPVPGLGMPAAPAAAPGMSTVLRCPLPILTTPSPDNLRQYYSGGSIPQYRINPPRPISTLF
jgi:hypothetical protein